MTQVRLELNEIATRILDVFKGKFGLKNRSEALNRFMLENGAEYIDFVNEKALMELDKTHNEHIKKHGFRSMSEKELDNILGLE